LGHAHCAARRVGLGVEVESRTMMRNPVMFVVEVGSVVTTALLFRVSHESFSFNLQITLWLWFTVLFANFAEAMAEGRGKAQRTLYARLGRNSGQTGFRRRETEIVPSSKLRTGTLCLPRLGISFRRRRDY